MIPENVTLLVKTPNQGIEDQNIECQSSWTVRQLKLHLAEVYPSKPEISEQKIIYCGQLLEDTAVLKDILRTYESQIAHTMHLVCKPKRVKMDGFQPNKADTPDGVRQRTPQSTREPNAQGPRAETRQNDQNHTVEMQNYLTSFMSTYGRVPPYPPTYLNGYLPINNDPAAMANHMMMMQQAYLQYMQQYANMWQAGANGTAGPQVGNVTNNEPQPQQPVQPAAQPAAEVEEVVQQDWLDWTYAASRVAVLFSLVYFYSSPFRFLLVLLLCAMLYLHQVGFFRDLGVNAANNENQQRREEPPPVNPEPQNIPNQEPETTPLQDTPITEIVQNDNQQSMLAFTWMIFSSFFSSLIPETS